LQIILQQIGCMAMDMNGQAFSIRALRAVSCMSITTGL